MTDTTTLSGAMLDYYAALAENMPNPRLLKHQRDDTYICTIRQESFHRHFSAYSPTTNPALALPIIDKLLQAQALFANATGDYVACMLKSAETTYGKDITEAALRALVAWKFPDGLPEPVYEDKPC